MRKTVKTSRRIKPQPSGKKQSSKSLVKVNEAPIRKKYISGFNKAKKEIDKYQKDLDEFEKEDQPAFSQWYDHIFGMKISELRELDQKASELERLLDEIEFVKYQKRTSYYRAYLYVKNNEGNVKETQKEHYSGKDYDKVDEKYEKKRNRNYTEEEKEDIEEIFQQLIDSNPALREWLRKNENAYKVFFEDFKKEFFGEDTSGRKDSLEKDNKNSEVELLKSRYRALVRKLHPDYRKKHDRRSEELWHEVQKAYSVGDLERLDTLNALCDIHTGDSDGSTSISQFMKIIAEYKARLKSMKMKIRQAQKTSAWKFSRTENREILKKSLDLSLTNDIKNRRMLLKHYESVLNKWGTPPRRS